MATNVERIDDLEARVTAIEESPVEVEGLQEVHDALAAFEAQIAALASAPALPVVATRSGVRVDQKAFQEAQTAAREKARASRQERLGG